MKGNIQHPIYGDIQYTESVWTSKKTLTFNGVPAQSISKNEFMIGDIKIELKGNYFSGVSILINGESMVLIAKPKWYEIILSVLPIVFIVVWGNNPTLCSIFPVIGGAIGGGFGAVISMLSIYLMKKVTKPIHKILIGIGVFTVGVLTASVLGICVVLLFTVL